MPRIRREERQRAAAVGALVTQAGPFSSAPNAPHALRIALGPIARDPLENALREVRRAVPG